MTTSNGHVPKWAVGIMLSLLGALAWLYVNDIKEDAREAKESQKQIELRVGAVEADLAGVRARLDSELPTIRNTLQRIEIKQDAALVDK